MSLAARTALLVAAVAAACGAAGPRPSVVERPWLEVRSAHFVLYTDLERRKAEDTLVGLERKYAALAHAYGLLVPVERLPASSTEVVFFASCGDLRVLTDFGGMVLPSRFGEPRVVTCADLRQVDRTLIHEIAHVFNAALIGHLPVWLEEGLAVYFETLALEHGELILGRFGSAPVAHEDHRVEVALDKLLVADYATFHHPATQQLYYHAAHGLVHLLNNRREELHRRFQDYLHRLAAGEGRGAAWEQAFAGVAMAELAGQLARYHLDDGKRVWRLPYDLPPPPDDLVTRPMRAGDVAGLWVSLALARGQDPAAQLAVLDDALRRDPGWPDLRLWQAQVALARVPPDPVTALALFRAQADAAPGDERPRMGILSTELEAHLGQVVGVDVDGARLAAFEGDAFALARVARSSTALNLAGWFFALRGMPKIGLGFARRALELDPTCWACQDTLALLLYHDGRVEEAIALQEIAVQAGAERATPGMVSRLEWFRKRSAKR